MTVGEEVRGEAPLVPPPLERTFDQAEVDSAARENGLEPIGVRPHLGAYLKDLWSRRSFIKVMAISKAYA
ncbi:MAG: hypothetical protein ACTHUU_15840, partial [Brachybacterium sp.]